MMLTNIILMDLIMDIMAMYMENCCYFLYLYKFVLVLRTSIRVELGGEADARNHRHLHEGDAQGRQEGQRHDVAR